ncbi:MAG: M18 family aminopeptidase, partial [Marinobacter alexandrii]
MEHAEFNKDLLTFLDSSPTPWHAVSTMKDRLDSAGFVELDEKDDWSLALGQGYYVIRNGSSIVAFRTGQRDVTASGIRMVGAHTDSPCLKVKPNPEVRRKGFFQLGVEVYGGVLLNPWFDRDLSLAGRVTVLDEAGEVRDSLINFRKPVAFIPSLAIHLDREANSNRTVNPQTDLPPVLMQVPESDTTSFADLLRQQIATESGLKVRKVLGYELSFYDAREASFVGLRDEFI